MRTGTCLAAALGLAIAAPRVAAQESDFIDARDLGDRGFVLESSTGRRTMTYDVEGVGDFDGDGFDDFVVQWQRSAEADAPPTPEWAAALVYGRPGLAGRHVLSEDFPRAALFQSDPLRGSFQSVRDVVPLGDLDGDGLDDFCFGLQRYQIQLDRSRGTGFIVYGARDLPARVAVEDIGAGVRGVVFSSSDLFFHAIGTSAALLEDFNGDGRRDLALSAPFSNLLGRQDCGAVFILHDVDNLPPLVDLAGVGEEIPGVRFYGRDRSRLGQGVEAVGDFDGDGLSDLLVSSAGDLVRTGVFLIRGRDDHAELVDLDIIHGGGAIRGVHHFYRSEDEDDNRFFGHEGQLDGLGDLDGDGLDDIALSVTRLSTPLFGAGPPSVVHIIRGRPALPDVIESANIPALGGTTTIHAPDGATDFGFPLSSARDVNEDGIPDLLFGAPRGAQERGDYTGEAFLLHGRRDFPADVFLANGFDGLRVVGEASRLFFGAELSPGGDFNGDGSPDILVLASAQAFTEDASRVYVIYGTGDGVAPLRAYRLEPPFGPQRGSVVEIVGSGFRSTPVVFFGETRAAVVTVLSPTRLRVEAPPSATLGLVQVRVVSEGEEVSVPGGYEYIPAFPEFDLDDLGAEGFVLHGAGTKIEATAMGDVTGDGMDDLLVGADGDASWQITVVRGGAGLPAEFAPGETSARLSRLTSDEPIGPAVSYLTPLADVNGDGIGDLAISIGDKGGYILFGRRELSAVMTIEGEVAAGRAARVFRGTGIDSEFHFAPLDDVDGDEIADLAIGIPGDLAGEVVVVAGRREWPEFVELSDPRSLLARLGALPGAVRFGRGLVAAGDVDGDGTSDLLSSASAPFGSEVSVAFLIRVVPPLILASDAVVRIEVELVVGDGGGREIHVAPAGDTDGDGLAEFLLGYEGGGTSVQGVTYLVQEVPRAPLLRIASEPDEPDGVVRLFGGFHGQSSAATNAGDFNADGHDDIVVRSYSSAPTAPPDDIFGIVSVVFGGADLPPRIQLDELRASGLNIESTPPSFLWLDTPAAGDLDGDGRADFVVRETRVSFEGGSPIDTVRVIYSPFGKTSFTRGDANDDGRIDISDGTYILSFLFLGGARPGCEDAADTDDTGRIELTDGVYLLNHLFLGGEAPPPPYPLAGEDPTEDALGCVGF